MRDHNCFPIQKKCNMNTLKKRKLCFVGLNMCFLLPVSGQGVLKTFSIKREESIMQTFFREQGCKPDDGVIVISSLIPNLEFSIPDAPGRLRNCSYDANNKRYILCLQPTDREDQIGGYFRYSIDVVAPDYKTEMFVVDSVDACMAQYFVINPKRSRRPLIEDWRRDFKVIIGLCNGIVGGEILGLYGELKFGLRDGFSLEVGAGGTPKYEEKNDFRWSVGFKGYVRYFYFGVYYGTAMGVWNPKESFILNDDGRFKLPGRHIKGDYGTSFLLGYDRNWRWFHLNVGVGCMATTIKKPKCLFVWNVGIGVSLIDAILK